jgi:UDP-N-acetyl-D-galactosamine dehydrogenase
VADREEAHREYGIALCDWEDLPVADAVILAVAHKELTDLPPAALRAKVAETGWIVDVKACLDKERFGDMQDRIWRL